MYLKEDFNENLNQLVNYRGKRGWKIFFETADSLKVLDNEYNDAAHTSVPKELEDKIVSKIKSLESLKEDAQQRVIGSNKSLDYDAVEDLIYSCVPNKDIVFYYKIRFALI